MAFGQKEIKDRHAMPLVNSIEQHIDKQMSDPDFFLLHRRGHADDPWWKFVYPGELDSQSKLVLQQRYYKVGWGVVVVYNSTDVGRPKGTIHVILKREWSLCHPDFTKLD